MSSRLLNASYELEIEALRREREGLLHSDLLEIKLQREPYHRVQRMAQDDSFCLVYNYASHQRCVYFRTPEDVVVISFPDYASRPLVCFEGRSRLQPGYFVVRSGVEYLRYGPSEWAFTSAIFRAGDERLGPLGLCEAKQHHFGRLASRDYESLVSEITKCFTAGEGDDVGGSLARLIRDACGDVTLEAETPVSAPERLVTAIEYIRDNPRFDLKVSAIAAHCGCSARALSYLFRDYIGVSTKQFVQAVVMNRVRRLLHLGMREDRLQGIARDFGISNWGRFANTYFELFHEYPRASRQIGMQDF